MIFGRGTPTRRIAQDASQEACWAVAKAGDAFDAAEAAVDAVDQLRKGHLLLCAAVLVLALMVFSLARLKNG